MFVGHKSFLWGHWYPCFGLLVTSALGFKVRVDSLTCMLPRLCTTWQHGMAAELSWSTYLQTCLQALVEVRGSNPRPSVPHTAQRCRPPSHSSSVEFEHFDNLGNLSFHGCNNFEHFIDTQFKYFNRNEIDLCDCQFRVIYQMNSLSMTTVSDHNLEHVNIAKMGTGQAWVTYPVSTHSYVILLLMYLLICLQS